MDDRTETRAAALGHVLRHAALVPGPVTLNSLFYSTMQSLSLPEEKCSVEIYKALSVLARAGLLICNTHDGASGSTTFAAETTFRPSQSLIDYMWSDPANVDGFYQH